MSRGYIYNKKQSPYFGNIEYDDYGTLRDAYGQEYDPDVDEEAQRNGVKYSGGLGGWEKQWDKAGYAGKIGMGIGALGAGVGLINSLRGMFGGGGMTREEREMEALARGGMSQADSFGGQMGQMGLGLQQSGRQALEAGRSQYLDALTNPNIANLQRARLASDLSNSRRGIENRIGLMNGPGAAAAYARNASAFTPDYARGSVQATEGLLNRGLQAGQARINFGQQDFGQGLGLRSQGYGIQSQGRQNLTNTLARIDAAAQQRAAMKQQAFGNFARSAGQLASGGIF